MPLGTISPVERIRLNVPPGPYLPVPAHAALASVGAVVRFGRGGPGDLCFCDQLPDPAAVAPDDASTVLCTREIAERLRVDAAAITAVAVDDPRAVFVDLLAALDAAGALDITDRVPGPHVCHPETRIGANSIIAPGARIDAGAQIGCNVVVHRGVWVQAGAIIGDGVVLGGSGMNAYRGRDGRVRRFPHVAGLVVGEGVEIGTNCVVVRGTLTSTVIGDGSIIGHLCNIGHSVVMGAGVWVGAGTTLAGHVRVGAGATIGLGCVVRPNLSIGEGAQAGMGSVIVRDVRARQSVFGNPAAVVPPISAGPERR